MKLYATNYATNYATLCNCTQLYASYASYASYANLNALSTDKGWGNYLINTFSWNKWKVAAYSARPTSASVTRKAIFRLGKLILKTMIFCDKTTILNEKKHLNIVFRSVPDSVSFDLDRPNRSGLTGDSISNCPQRVSKARCTNENVAQVV